MKLLLFVTTIAFSVAYSAGQARPTTAADYNGAFRYAVSETNAAFPFIFTVVIDEYENGNNVLSETMVDERQAAGVERITRTIFKDGKKSVSYQTKVGFGIVYCSEDGVSWTGPQKFECSGPSRMYGRRNAKSSEYSVEEKALNGEKVKIYREYVVYAPRKARGKRNSKKPRQRSTQEDFSSPLLITKALSNPKRSP